MFLLTGGPDSTDGMAYSRISVDAGIPELKGGYDNINAVAFLTCDAGKKHQVMLQSSLSLKLISYKSTYNFITYGIIGMGIVSS